MDAVIDWVHGSVSNPPSRLQQQCSHSLTASSHDMRLQLWQSHQGIVLHGCCYWAAFVLTFVLALKAVRGADWGVTGEPATAARPTAVLACGVAARGKPAVLANLRCKGGRIGSASHIDCGAAHLLLCWPLAGLWSLCLPCCQHHKPQHPEHQFHSCSLSCPVDLQGMSLWGTLATTTHSPWLSCSPLASWGCCCPGLVLLVATALQLCQEALRKTAIDERGAGFAPVAQFQVKAA
jgi:hypothetical protein